MTLYQLHAAAMSLYVAMIYIINVIYLQLYLIFVNIILLQHDLVVVPATRHLLPSDQEYMMRYIPLHQPTINESHKLIVRDVS